jgi:hypothetical chaperone protein
MIAVADRIGIGIDFGTTNSVAAFFDGEKITLVHLEARDPVMPSATYIDSALQTDTGKRAIERYIADNTGRTVELIPEVISESSQFVEHQDEENPAPVETVTQQFYGQPLTDSGLPGRLFRGTKRLLGDERVRRLLVFDHPFRLVALITPILLRIRRSIEQQTGVIASAHLGHPVNFEGRDNYRNQLALSRLSEAYRYAGIHQQSFYPEPVAAAASYLQTGNFSGETLLTVDFGGGTLDLCVLRRQCDGFEVMSTHGIALGGDHIDQRMFRELLFPLLGKGEMWRRRGMDREIETRFPFEDYEELLVNWAVTYTLNQNRYTTPVMDYITQGGPAQQKFTRLREIIKQNASYLVFQKLKDLKAALSETESAVLDIPELDIELKLGRGDFEVMIADQLRQVAQVVDETVQLAGLRHDEIDVVLRTGGSSLIPAVTRILEARFPGRVDLHDPFTSVAAGLAIANFRGLSFSR